MVQPLHLDPDKPIPYVLTEKGRADLAAALIEEQQDTCPHQFGHYKGCVSCEMCGLDLGQALDRRPTMLGPSWKRD